MNEFLNIPLNRDTARTTSHDCYKFIIIYAHVGHHVNIKQKADQ